MTRRERLQAVAREYGDRLTEVADFLIDLGTKIQALVPEGSTVAPGNFLRNTWRPILAGTSLHQGLTPNELRVTCAALLIAKGADPKAIQAQMRHSSISVTFDVYGHLFRGHLDADQRAARPGAQ